MDNEVRKAWEDFLKPEVLRSRLIHASLYIACFEVSKELIIDRLKFFFCNGFDESGYIFSPEYKSDVLSRNSSPVYASLDWLKEHGAINEEDIDIYNRVKGCRNHLAHELFTVVGSEGMPSDFEQCLGDLIALASKIETWWIREVEIPTDPDLYDKDIVEEDIVPGPLMFFKMLFDVALGDEKESNFYYEEFQKHNKQNK